jgi:hypothetical protein
MHTQISNVCMRACACACVPVYARSPHMCPYAHKHRFICIYVCVCTYIYIYIYKHTTFALQAHVCTHTHTHTRTALEVLESSAVENITKGIACTTDAFTVRPMQRYAQLQGLFVQRNRIFCPTLLSKCSGCLVIIKTYGEE